MLFAFLENRESLALCAAGGITVDTTAVDKGDICGTALLARFRGIIPPIKCIVSVGAINNDVVSINTMNEAIGHKQASSPVRYKHLTRGEKKQQRNPDDFQIRFIYSLYD